MVVEGKPIVVTTFKSLRGWLAGDQRALLGTMFSSLTFLRFVCFLPIFTFLTSCAGKQSALDAAGPQADRIGRLWWFMFWSCVAVFAAVMAALAYAVVRGRTQHQTTATAGPAGQSIIPPDAGSEKRMTRVIGIAVALTIVILFAMLIFDFATGRALKSLASPEPVVIQLTGHQWWWDVKYDDPTPGNVVTTANEIHIPVGQPIMLKGTSTDVIHSFWVPNLHGKKDLIPGQQTVTWFQADRAGIYRGQCAEFCGYQHAKMALLVIAESPEDFQAWLEHQRAAAEPPANADEQRGQRVFLNAPCVMCHTIRGTAAGSRFGPDLTHLSDRQTIAAASLPNSEAHLRQWITNSQESKPGNRMPPVPLGADDLQALLSYLRSLK
jgi:cytochrome c oxidase subunit II